MKGGEKNNEYGKDTKTSFGVGKFERKFKCHKIPNRKNTKRFGKNKSFSRQNTEIGKERKMYIAQEKTKHQKKLEKELAKTMRKIKFYRNLHDFWHFPKNFEDSQITKFQSFRKKIGFCCDTRNRKFRSLRIAICEFLDEKYRNYCDKYWDIKDEIKESEMFQTLEIMGTER